MQSTRRPQLSHSTSKIRLITTSRQLRKSVVCVNYDYATGYNATGYNTAVIQFCSNKSTKYLRKSWHIIEQFYDFT